MCVWKHFYFVFLWEDTFAGNRIINGIVFQLFEKAIPQSSGLLYCCCYHTSTFRLIVVLLKIMCLCIRMNCLSFGFTTMCLFKLPCVCILSGAYTVSWIGCLLSFSVYFLIIQILLPVVLMPCFLFYISTPGGTAISPVSDPITTSHTFLRVYYRSMLWSGYYLDTILPFSDLLVRCV